jgi:hypothetical protein
VTFDPQYPNQPPNPGPFEQPQQPPPQYAQGSYSVPGIPPAGQPAPPTYGAPAPQPKKKSKAPMVLGIVAAVVLVCCGGVAIISATSKSTPAATTAATGSPATTNGAKPVQAAPTTAAAVVAPTTAAAPQPKTLLTLKGSGIKKSATFTTGDEWILKYTYDCSNFGSSGNFQVYLYTDGTMGGVLVNELAAKGNDTAPQHGDAGSHYLEMNSECSWTVTVTG